MVSHLPTRTEGSMPNPNHHSKPPTKGHPKRAIHPFGFWVVDSKSGSPPQKKWMGFGFSSTPPQKKNRMDFFLFFGFPSTEAQAPCRFSCQVQTQGLLASGCPCPSRSAPRVSLPVLFFVFSLADVNHFAQASRCFWVSGE